MHVGPERIHDDEGGGPCTWPEPARWLRAAPNVVTISRSMYEVDGLPLRAVHRCNHFDEVWVPASFNVNTFIKGATIEVAEEGQIRAETIGVHESRIRVLPEGYDPAIFDCAATDTPGTDNRQLARGDRFDWSAAATSSSYEKDDQELEQQDDEALDEGAQLPFRLRQFLAPHTSTHNDLRRHSRPLLPKPAFLFLSVFKWEARKGWKDLLQAFWAEFCECCADRVRLLIKTSFVENLAGRPLDRPANDIAAWAWELGYDVSAAMAQVYVMDEMVTMRQLAVLYCTADAFVIATHGEGWGLPMLEAMASGLPTIAPRWGGHVDFMKGPMAFLVDIEPSLVPVHGDGWEGYGYRWAKVEHRALRRTMRQVVQGDAEVWQTAKENRRQTAKNLKVYDFNLIAKQTVMALEQAAERSLQQPRANVVDWGKL